MATRAAALLKRKRNDDNSDKNGATSLENQLNQRAHPTLETSIRLRAHEIYLQRGGQQGAEMDDWLQAEREILGS